MDETCTALIKTYIYSLDQSVVLLNVERLPILFVVNNKLESFLLLDDKEVIRELNRLINQLSRDTVVTEFEVMVATFDPSPSENTNRQAYRTMLLVYLETLRTMLIIMMKGHS